MTAVDEADVTAPALRSQRAALAGVLVALLLAAMDSTVVGTILPVMRRQLSGADLYPWLLSAFLLTAVLSAAVAGRVTDRWDDRKTLLASIAVFVAGSVVVGAATDMAMAVAGRAVQGIGAGAITAAAYTYVGRLADGKERARLQGILSSVWGLAAVLGPVFGGICTGAVSWRLAFYINLPLAAVASVLLITAPARPAHPEGDPVRAQLGRRPLIALGASAVTLVGVLVLVQAGAVHLPMAAVAVTGGVVIVSLAFQVSMARQGASGLIPHAFFSAVTPRRAGLATAAATACLYAAVTLLPLDLASASRTSVYASSIVVAGAALGWVLGSALTSATYHRLGARGVAFAGTITLAGGAALLALPAPGGTVLAFVPGQLLLGLGTGLVTATALLEVQAASPAAQLGTMTSTVSLLRNVGAAIGINAFTALATGLTGSTAHASRLTFLAVAALGLATAAAVPLRRPSGPTSA